ncbi:MAG TPA: hypothetical protein VH023_07155 [Rhodopila sp.]|jgi:hypothetical protein|nr:hypothetical protein [Rhodopila sp.]
MAAGRFTDRSGGQYHLKSRGTMIHAVINMEIRTKTPNPSHMKMISSRDLSSLSDAQSSMALKIRRILIPNPQIGVAFPYGGTPDMKSRRVVPSFAVP